MSFTLKISTLSSVQAAVILGLMLLGPTAMAQGLPPSARPSTQDIAPLTPAQMDQLTAPVALYPDALLAQILMASTYPLEVVQAERWATVPAHAALRGDMLVAALLREPWEPSVKSLTAVPHILTMMDHNLNWTVRLGDEFLAAQSAVFDSVQRLRHQAEAAGKLKSTSQMAVSTMGAAIVIAAADPVSVDIPVYNPNDVYGVWASRDNPPDYFPDSFPGVAIGPLGFGWFKVDSVGALWEWDSVDWGGHAIKINQGWFNAMNRHHPAARSEFWQHDPSHRGGVPYLDAAVRARFQAAATPERAARGYPTVPVGSAGVVQAPEPSAPRSTPFFGPSSPIQAATPPPLTLPAPPAPPPVIIFPPQHKN